MSKIDVDSAGDKEPKKANGRAKLRLALVSPLALKRGPYRHRNLSTKNCTLQRFFKA
jgi:hypothetical protein